MNLKKIVALGVIGLGISFQACAADAPAQPAAPTAAQVRKPAMITQEQIAHMREARMQHLRQELSLSDDQVKAIEKIQQETQAQARQQAQESRKNGAADELASAMDMAPDSKEYDQTVKSAAEAAAKVAADNARNRVLGMAEARKKVYAVLNAEQKKKYLAMKPARNPVPIGTPTPAKK